LRGEIHEDKDTDEMDQCAQGERDYLLGLLIEAFSDIFNRSFESE